MKTLKAAKTAGRRTVAVVPGSRRADGHALTVVVDDGQTASLYDVAGDGSEYTVQKVDADGTPLNQQYTVLPGAGVCSCKGNRLGRYYCRHLGMLAALSARGQL